MAIEIIRGRTGYRASASPPHSKNGVWQSSGELTASEVVHILQELGCHQTDIGDALFKANPDWLADQPWSKRRPNKCFPSTSSPRRGRDWKLGV